LKAIKSAMSAVESGLLSICRNWRPREAENGGQAKPLVAHVNFHDRRLGQGLEIAYTIGGVGIVLGDDCGAGLAL
jgi:hypothetical protein